MRRALLATLLILLLGPLGPSGFGLAARADEPPTSARGFPLYGSDFTHWTEHVREWLVGRSMPTRTSADVELNMPFERTADPAVEYRGRYLLFHGLNDSPAVWHDMADELTARGFDVRALLFAGHGTTPRDMLEVEWESWLRAARAWMQAWLDEDASTPLYLGGFSMGGVIATLLALDEPRIDGLLLISPAFKSSLDRWLRFSGIYARFRPWVFGGMILEDNPIKYNSIPVNSGWQFFGLTRALMKRWRKQDRIDIPALVVMSSEDSVVETAYTRRVFRRRFTHPSRQLITYAPSIGPEDSPAVGAVFEELERDLEPREALRDSRQMHERVLGQSHLSLTNAPDNPLFGRNGRVLVCNGNEYPVFMACMRAEGHWFGAQHTPSPDGIPVARTTWNPDWEEFLWRFDTVFGIDSGDVGDSGN